MSAISIKDLALFEYQAQYNMLNERIQAYMTELQNPHPVVDTQLIASYLYNATFQMEVLCKDIRQTLLP